MSEPRAAGDWMAFPIVPPCTGWCRGARSAYEGPTVYSDKTTPDGRKIPLCKCCHRLLTFVSASADSDAAGVPAEKLAAGVMLDQVARFHCQACGYDVVSGARIKPR